MAGARLEHEGAAVEVERLAPRSIPPDILLLVLAAGRQPHRRRAVRRRPRHHHRVVAVARHALRARIRAERLPEQHVPRPPRRPRLVVLDEQRVVGVVQELPLDLEEAPPPRPVAAAAQLVVRHRRLHPALGPTVVAGGRRWEGGGWVGGRELAFFFRRLVVGGGGGAGVVASVLVHARVGRLVLDGARPIEREQAPLEVGIGDPALVR